MSNFVVVIQSIAINGPYAYSIIRDGVGLKAATNQANIGVAMSNAQADVAANLGGESVIRATLTVHTQ